MPPVPGQVSTVSIVIVNFNGATILERCLASVFRQPYRPIEVIVVDNASTDDSVAAVRRAFPQVHLILNDANNGFALATNQGVARAQGEYIVLLNNDTLVERDWLSGLLEAIRRTGVGVATSKVVTDGVPPEYYEMNGTINFLGYNIMRVFRELSEVFFAGGASVIFSRQEVGEPFLSEYFLYQEDVYLSWRMRLRGYEIRMAQSSLVRHSGSATAKYQPSRLVTFYQERNRLLNCLLMYESGTLLRLMPLFLADALSKLALSVVAGRKSPAGIIGGYWWCARHPGWIREKRRRLQDERRVRDSDIMQRMSPHLMNAGGAVASSVNRMARAYADLVGLAYHA